MRILHIMAGRGLGGAETYATDIMLSLHEAGVDQAVVMAGEAPRMPEIVTAGIRTAPQVLATRFRPWQKFMLRRTLAREKPDLVHCWMRRAASLMPRWDKGPVIGWFGGYYEPRHFKHCDHFVGVTKDIVAHMVREGVAADHAHFVPTFPDVKGEAPLDRATLATSPDALVLLALSRLHPKKGLDTLLRAAVAMPQAVVWLAGEGPLRQELEQLARSLGIAERVRFLGWRTDRGALLRAADICVLPSRYEPFGTVILEAWAAGTPLVACRSAGPEGAVTDGVNGLLTPIDDVAALTEAFKRVKSDDDLRRRLIAQGYATYCRDYTRPAVTARMMALYESLIAAHGRGG